MSDEKIQQKFLHFVGLHYDHWSELMENLLCANDLWSLVDTNLEELGEGNVLIDVELQELEHVKTKDLRVKLYLFRDTNRSIFELVLNRRTSMIV